MGPIESGYTFNRTRQPIQVDIQRQQLGTRNHRATKGWIAIILMVGGSVGVTVALLWMLGGMVSQGMFK